MDTELRKVKKVFLEAKRRCTNKNHKQFLDYGGRGIKFNFVSFDEFYKHLGPRPFGYQLDRINNDGHYEIGNVRWTTSHVNSINTRRCKNTFSGIKGVTFKKKYSQWVARIQTYPEKQEKQLYVGKDFFEACCARLSWELHQSSEQT